jgi:molybdopterin molybdotransferase
MVSVEEAERIILAEIKNYGTELIPFESAIGRVLAADIKADRDLPPCNRATMDGIAISYSALEKGIRSFQIKAIIAAGDAPVEMENENECAEIMTGAPLPDTTDTVIRYEDVEIKNSTALVTIDTIKKGQNIHRKGKDKQAGEVVAVAHQFITPALISMAASVGKTRLPVKKLPKVVVVTTGDELVGVGAQPTAYQVRQSNNYTIKAVLQQYGLNADLLYIPDDPKETKEKIKKCLEDYDVVILTGGISMGKFDYVPKALEELNVSKLFHKVQQRPGKPFWFGIHEDKVLVFAFPGNPVSTFMCLHRYFIPWLETSLTANTQIPNSKFQIPKLFAILDEDVAFTAPLKYFMQVKLKINEQGHLLAIPKEGNGSGDFTNLLDTDAFMELPLEQSTFRKGEVYRVWPFKQIM